MKVLVAVVDYPTTNGRRSLYYVHSRNIYYKKAGMDVTVLNFAADKEYDIDGIRVLSIKEYVGEITKNRYDILICHAANLRKHYCFLKKHQNEFKRVVFIYHGHEILHINKYYPQPFKFYKKNRMKIFQDIYDSIKIKVWKKYIVNNIYNIKLVFVSEYLYKIFMEEFKIKEHMIENNVSVISNSIGSFFENNQYEFTMPKYDFITIRNRFDESTYGIDIIVKLANENPKYRFCVIGKGNYFKQYDKPDNVILIQRELQHEEMREYLNASRVALMPTRHDSQGLMACEMASYGLPLITSDIEVCRDIFRTCPNVAFIDNDKPELDKALSELKIGVYVEDWRQYYKENTIIKEIEFIEACLDA